MTAFQGPAAHQWYSAAWKLHVELVGEESVWRDVLVPESMPLRILRYVIDQLFSLSPTLEYQFSLPEEEFIRQTDDRFTEYCRLCGARFRFPTIRDEEACCSEQEQDPIGWLRKRYRGSYAYHGNADHLVENQQAVRNFLMVFTGLRESPVIDLNEYRRGEVKVEKTKRAPAASLSMQEMLEAELFKTHPNQVLERLRIPEVLLLYKKKVVSPDLPEPEEFYPDLLWGGYFDRCFARLERIHQRSMEAVRIYHELMDRHVRLDEELDEETEILVSQWADAQQEARVLEVRQKTEQHHALTHERSLSHGLRIRAFDGQRKEPARQRLAHEKQQIRRPTPRIEDERGGEEHGVLVALGNQRIHRKVQRKEHEEKHEARKDHGHFISAGWINEP